jgi:hypothetical protein
MKSFALSLLAAAAAMTTGMAHADTVFTVSSWLAPTHTAQHGPEGMVRPAGKEHLRQDQVQHPAARCQPLPRAPSTPCKNGLADLSFTVHGYTPGRFVLHPDGRGALPGQQGRAAVGGVPAASPPSIPGQFTAEHQGVKVLAYFTHGPGIVFNTKRPITKADDLQG